jgi:hypothetical protein
VVVVGLEFFPAAPFKIGMETSNLSGAEALTKLKLGQSETLQWDQRDIQGN